MIFSKTSTPTGFYVYAYLREDGSPYYIGKGQRKRAWQHNHKERLQTPLDHSRISVIAHRLSEDEAHLLESKLISMYGRKDIGTGILQNRTDGGGGVSGSIRPDITLLFKGKPRTFSDKHRERITQSKKGVPIGKQMVTTCPHCGISGGKSLITRYHHDNCKKVNKKVKKDE